MGLPNVVRQLWLSMEVYLSLVVMSVWCDAVGVERISPVLPATFGLVRDNIVLIRVREAL
jgi:hypothetical protein